MHGLHLTADLRGCPVDRPVMTELAALKEVCFSAVTAAGLSPVAELFHRFACSDGDATQTGITGVVLLAESHLAVHTWPETGAVTLDAYVCNRGGDNSARAEALMTALIDVFSPAGIERYALMRGTVDASSMKLPR